MRAVWIARAVLGATLLALAGCETMNLPGLISQPKEPVATGSTLPPPGQALAPPRPAGVKLTLGKTDAGMTFQVKTGDRIAVNLVGVPTAGYEWGAPKPPAILKLVEKDGGPTISDQLYPGYTGGNHWEVLVFEAVKTGSGRLKLEQRRSWETKEKPADTFQVSFEVIK